MKKETIAFLNEHYKSQMMWLTACHLRTLQQDIWKLGSNGVKIQAMESYLESINKQFRFAAECEYEDEIMKDLEKFKNTMISYDEMMNKICMYNGFMLEK